MRMGLLFVVLTLLGIVTFAESACKSGWIRHGSNCYHFSHDQEDWLNAKGVCELIGGTLLEINDADENNFVAGQIIARGTHYDAWIALTDLSEENVWVWMISGATLTSGNFTSWSHDQPNNSGGKQSCVRISDSGNWSDDECGDKFYYVCEASDSSSVVVIG